MEILYIDPLFEKFAVQLQIFSIKFQFIMKSNQQGKNAFGDIVTESKMLYFNGSWSWLMSLMLFLVSTNKSFVYMTTPFKLYTTKTNSFPRKYPLTYKRFNNQQYHYRYFPAHPINGIL